MFSKNFLKLSVSQKTLQILSLACLAELVRSDLNQKRVFLAKGLPGRKFLPGLQDPKHASKKLLARNGWGYTSSEILMYKPCEYKITKGLLKVECGQLITQAGESFCNECLEKAKTRAEKYENRKTLEDIDSESDETYKTEQQFKNDCYKSYKIIASLSHRMQHWKKGTELEMDTTHWNLPTDVVKGQGKVKGKIIKVIKKDDGVDRIRIKFKNIIRKKNHRNPDKQKPFTVASLVMEFEIGEPCLTISGDDKDANQHKAWMSQIEFEKYMYMDFSDKGVSRDASAASVGVEMDFGIDVTGLRIPGDKTAEDNGLTSKVGARSPNKTERRRMICRLYTAEENL